MLLIGFIISRTVVFHVDDKMAHVFFDHIQCLESLYKSEKKPKLVICYSGADLDAFKKLIDDADLFQGECEIEKPGSMMAFLEKRKTEMLKANGNQICSVNIYV